MRENPVAWFEIPVTDMKRAIAFYNSVFACKLEAQDMGELQMAWLPFNHETNGASGSLVYHPDFYKPSETHGIVIYFSVDDVNNELSRVEAAGGKVIHEKKAIGENHGFMAVFLDSEGNRLALHSNK